MNNNAIPDSSSASTKDQISVLDVLHTLPEPLLLTDHHWRITQANAASGRAFNLDTAQLIGMPIWELWPASSKEAMARALAATPAEAVSTLQANPLRTSASDWRLRVQGHNWGWSIQLMEPKAVTASGVDSALLHKALDRLNDIVIITDAGGVDTPYPRIVYVNDAFERRTGFTREEAIGETPRMLQGPLTQRAALNQIREALKQWQPVRCELINYTKAGTPFWLELDIVPMADATGWYTHWVAIERDATDRKSKEELAQRTQRLDAVAQLSAGLAHDFNNVLTVTLGYAELLVQRLAAQPSLHGMANEISRAARRGSELTSRLLTFAQRTALRTELQDVNKIVDAIREVLRRTLDARIVIDIQQEPDLWPTMVDSSQLENTLLYLALNARDAMPKGGQLRIETANVTLRHEQFPHEIEAVSGDFVMLTMSDTGCGIAPEHINQVFEPFYTTKAKGTGAGMGLSMVYGFLRQSGGHIKLASEPGAGTRVSLYLARKAEAQGTVTLQPQESPVKTILLVEDDEFVRRYAEGLLRNLGFRVITAADGPSALMVLKELSQLSLLFTDIVMPGGMFGGELVDAVRSLRPDLPVLLTTGYSETEITGHGPLPANAPVLRKPYSPQQLAEAVERCLSPSGASATT